MSADTQRTVKERCPDCEHPWPIEGRPEYCWCGHRITINREGRAPASASPPEIEKVRNALLRLAEQAGGYSIALGDGSLPRRSGRIARDALAAIEALEREAADDDALRDRMRDLLTRTANALKGDPGPLKLHDWSDLPEVAARLRAMLSPQGKGE
jgi:hypothetical protein